MQKHFPVRRSRVVITTATQRRASKDAVEATVFVTSRIGCTCEAGIKRHLKEKETLIEGWEVLS